LIRKGSTLCVRRWDGTAWTRLPDAVERDGCLPPLVPGAEAQALGSSALALTSAGSPVVAYLERVGAENVVRLQVHTPSGWQSLGGSEPMALGSAADHSRVDVALDAMDRPTVTFVTPA